MFNLWEITLLLDFISFFLHIWGILRCAFLLQLQKSEIWLWCWWIPLDYIYVLYAWHLTLVYILLYIHRFHQRQNGCQISLYLMRFWRWWILFSDAGGYLVTWLPQMCMESIDFLVFNLPSPSNTADCCYT